MVRPTASAAMSATRTASASSASIPRYRNPALTSRLPPPKLPLFRSVVAHPPAPWATQQQQPESATSEALKKDAKGKGKGKADKVRERSRPDFRELGPGSAHPACAIVLEPSWQACCRLAETTVRSRSQRSLAGRTSVTHPKKLSPIATNKQARQYGPYTIPPICGHRLLCIQAHSLWVASDLDLPLCGGCSPDPTAVTPCATPDNADMVWFPSSRVQAEAATSSTSSSTPAPSRPLVGPSQILYSTAPRPLIPLTSSPFNHKLWNPPAPDSAHRGVLEKDESGRMARFEAMFGDAFGTAETVGAGEGDKSLMEGDGTGRALGQVVGKEHLQKAKRVKPSKGRR